MTWKDSWRHYLDTHERGSYQDRLPEYERVAGELRLLGLGEDDLIVDLGAGTCDFARFMYTNGWTGLYVPYDAAIQGIDLDTWDPGHDADWVISIQTVEHLQDPEGHRELIEKTAQKGAVVTTPNGQVAEFYEMDPTHVHPVDLHSWPGWSVSMASFSKEDDTLVGIWRAKGELE